MCALLFSFFSFVFFLDILFDIWNKNQLNDENESSKVFWDDEELIRLDRMRTGFGEHGKAAFLDEPAGLAQNKMLFKEFGMSLYISDKM